MKEIDTQDELLHYGTPRHSGRYPWGSGDEPYQRNKGFMSRYKELKDSGMTEADIAKALGCKNTAQLRAKKSIASAEVQKFEASMAIKLKEKGYSNVEIGKRLGRPESTVRNYLKPADESRADVNQKVVAALKEQLEKTGAVDVGKGSNLYLGVSETKMKTALEILKEEGYNVYPLSVQQAGTGKYTNMTVLTKKETTWREMYDKRFDIKPVMDVSIADDGHGEVQRVKPIENLDRKRIYVRYAEDGGTDKDGTIELRKGVKDLDMGGAMYSQVRIGVDGDKYMKGMAFYSDDIPDGYDIIYNTNKPRGSSDEKVFKPQTGDPNNPFGANIKPGGQRGALNIMREEGDWSEWSRNIPSQMLSKQPVELARKQLKLTSDIKDEQFKKIQSISNPVIKKKMLEDFADECDSDAVNLKAAALPRQATHVILPVPTMKENEVYAPNYKDGERVVLIRFPHGGKFEIPELIVNNKNKDAQKFMKNAKDAVGISPKVAAILSGADFDGDTCLVIPNNSGSIKTAKPLEGLKNFDPKEAYPHKEGQKPGWKKGSAREGTQMGIISNLITDMTLKGASEEELARAVRHSMVIIDTGKHKLDWNSSYYENGIPELQKKYQGKAGGGAGTLLSRSKGETSVLDRKERYEIDPETGAKIFTYTSKKTVDKKGNEVDKKIKSTKMYEAEDARQLLSDDPAPMELVYADYANYMKGLGNKARKESLTVPSPTRNTEASKKYTKQVASLDAKLNTALKNAPLERQAQLLANQMFQLKKEANPDMSKDEIKKAKGKSLVAAREIIGAKKEQIYITDDEWEAIQNNAITKTKLESILNNADNDRVMSLAMPKKDNNLSAAQKASIKSMLSRGYTYAEVADAFSVSTDTVAQYA